MAETTARIWQVGALCRAIANSLDASLNPVAVRGEISGLSRASSGHCYFSLKDNTGQLRCVMFKRAFGLLEFAPRDGQMVDLRGRLGIYEPRGDLQLIVESMGQGGPGALFEQFLKLKAMLEAEGLFDSRLKRELPPMPRGIGVVTSLGAAALHDVVSTLQRRASHIPVVVAPASVQGANAPVDLCRALEALYQHARPTAGKEGTAAPGAGARLAAWPVVDVIVLVRGGGSMEDLWAFNDEALARAIARSPVPVVCGVGHDTDFTIADFVADVRAPTPTAAAELVARSREASLGAIEGFQLRLQDSLLRRLGTELQRIDGVAARLGRPSSLAAVQRVALTSYARRLRFSAQAMMQQESRNLRRREQELPTHMQRALERARARGERADLRLGLLDPSLVLQRGYAWLADMQGRTITGPEQTRPGQIVRATVASGAFDLLVPTRD